MNKRYIASGGGGIGNQIKKLISAKRLHPDSQTDLGYFNDLFENQNLHHNGHRNGTPMCTWRLLVLPEDTEIQKNFNIHTTGESWIDPYSDWSVNVDGRNVDCEYLRIPEEYTNKILKIFNDYLTIHPDLQYWVNEFQKKYNNFSSIHIRSFNADNFCKNGANRGGDINPKAQARNRHYDTVQRNKIIEYVKNLKQNDIYISSDNRMEVDLLKRKFPERNFIHYTDVYDKPFESDYTNDFLDMILLSKGIEMVLCRISTYSEVAWYLSKCNKNINLY